MSLSELNKKISTIILGVIFIIMAPSCNDTLEFDPESELTPGTFLTTESGMRSLLVSAYNGIQWTSFGGANKMYSSVWMGENMWETGGGLNRTAVLFLNYTYDSSVGWFTGFWNTSFAAIRDANTVLDNIDRNKELNEKETQQIIAEARFVRASAYSFLYNWFGPPPLVTSSSSDNLEPSRASEDEIRTFIESEFSAIYNQLPEDAEPGRATKGAALGMLTKFFLNTKQWQKAADAAKDIIDMGKYELHPDYFELFQIENEDNNEFIFVHPAVNIAGEGNVLPPAYFPPGFPTPASHENWAAQVRLRDKFINSFEEGDERLELIVTEFTDVDGNHVQLLGDDNARSFKYWPDPDPNGRWTGNDIPEIRYSDILLSRAEALNELNGPNQESIDLINMVRDRADVSLLQLSDFGSKEELRNHILDERGWEFVHEAKRRQDMIRHGVLISNAQSRGINAGPKHRLFPIPQAEMDANPNLEQNPGF